MAKFVKPLVNIITLCLMGAGSAYATNVPTTADPSRNLNTPQTKPLEFKKAEPDTRPAASTAPNAPEGAEQALFTLQNIRIEGMTAYTENQIKHIYAADLGRTISVLRLFEILNAVQAQYLNDGYSLSRVTMPTQDIAAGNVVFQVVEGYAAEVTIDGALGSDPVLDDARNQIAAMRPLNTKRLEKILLTVNDLPGLNVSAILGSLASPTPSLGAVRLTLKKNPESEQSAVLGLNNHGSIFSGPFQITANAHQASVLTPYDDVAVSLAGAYPLSEMVYAGIKYQKPLWGASWGKTGLLLILEASTGRTAPGASLKELDIKGQSSSLKAGFEYPLIRQRDQTLKINSYFEMRKAKTDLADTDLYDDRLRILSIGANYNNADSFRGLNAFEITYSQGLDIFGTRKRGSVDLSRSEGGPDFQKVYVSAGRIQSLPLELDLLVAFQAQYASDPLLASEEFGFGGGQIGRGYDPSEITGDKGIAATAELRRNFSPANSRVAFQGYGFFDIGKVWNIDPSSKDRVSAASTGLGLRTALPNGWSSDTNLSIPLTLPAANPHPYGNGQSPRLLLSVQKRF